MSCWDWGMIKIILMISSYECDITPITNNDHNKLWKSWGAIIDPY